MYLSRRIVIATAVLVAALAGALVWALLPSSSAAKPEVTPSPGQSMLENLFHQCSGQQLASCTPSP